MSPSPARRLARCCVSLLAFAGGFDGQGYVASTPMLRMECHF